MNIRYIKKYSFIALICGILLLLIINKANNVFDNDLKNKNRFVLGVNTWVGFAPFYLAKEKGFFEEEGLEVDIIVIEDVAQRKIAMIRGDIDGLGDTVDLLVLSRFQNIPSIAVMQIDVSDGADGIVVSKDISTIQDLKHTPIAVQKNFVSESFLNFVAYKNNISLNDLNLIDMEAGAAGAAFLAGRVDAAVTFEPWLLQAKKRKDGRVLITTADEKGVIVDILTVSERYLQKNRENVKKIVRGWFRAIDYWEKNKGEANEIMSKYYNISKDEFADMISSLKWPSYSENISYFDRNSDVNIYKIAEIFNNIFLEVKKVDRKIDLDQAIDSSIIQDLYEE